MIASDKDPNLIGRVEERRGADEIDLLDVCRLIWDGRWLVVSVAVATLMFGMAYAFLAQPQYRADVSLIQSEEVPLASNLGRLGSLAGLAGLPVSVGSSSQQALATLRSREVAREFIEANNLESILLSQRRWAFSFVDKVRQRRVPDVRDAVKVFDKSVRAVAEDKRTGVINVSMTWSDPELAAVWANGFVRMVNEKLRQQRLKESMRNIDYLGGELKQSNIASLQQALSELLQAEMQKFLLASGQEDFAFKVVDKAEVPLFRSSPRRPLISVVSMIIGLGSGAMLVLVRSAVQRRRRSFSGG